MPPSRAPRKPASSPPAVPPQSPLSEDEITHIREIIEDRKWSRRFWATIRTYALWIAGVGAGTSVAWDSLKRLVSVLVPK